ncbi:TspO/MBR family protein [Pirellulimonas nuda]|uniref:TspO/MBR family protein n=1 Tax=Pirellulimonas nuda TaxID=2528009 RepID=A0A518DFE7_9BACT|nr:tryptophan-rich sensory protein [Pirellulimonas nuda]QDU90207.1 TspO/MBR family protein [Pirellulimonas nuda]
MIAVNNALGLVAWFALCLSDGALGAAATTSAVPTRYAGWLLAPYSVWVIFATVLNIAIWRQNQANPASWPAIARSE